MLIYNCLVKCKVFDTLCTLYTLIHMHKYTLTIIACWKPVTEYEAELLGHKGDNMIELQCLCIGLIIIGHI